MQDGSKRFPRSPCSACVFPDKSILFVEVVSNGCLVGERKASRGQNERFRRGAAVSSRIWPPRPVFCACGTAREPRSDHSALFVARTARFCPRMAFFLRSFWADAGSVCHSRHFLPAGPQECARTSVGRMPPRRTASHAARIRTLLTSRPLGCCVDPGWRRPRSGCSRQDVRLNRPLRACGFRRAVARLRLPDAYERMGL